MSAPPISLDSFKSRKTLQVGAKSYEYFSLPDAEKNGLPGLSKLPFSLKVLVENLLRFEDGRSVKADDVNSVDSDLATQIRVRIRASGQAPQGILRQRVPMSNLLGSVRRVGRAFPIGSTKHDAILRALARIGQT